MNKAFIINSYGGTEVLNETSIAMPKIGNGQVLIRHTHIGLNFIDTYFRTGLYKTPPFPLVLGAEAAGIIEEIGENVSGLKIGQRICYSAGLGAYQKYRAIDANLLVPIPEGVENKTAAACLLKGMTAYILLNEVTQIDANSTIFYHAAAGGVGLILGQWAKLLGAKIFGTAGGSEKCAIAKNHGFDYVIDYKTEDFVAKALELNNGKKFDVVYDSVGKDTFLKSFDLVRPRGLMVSFGQSSGPSDAFEVGLLNQKGSLFLTRPSLFAYTSNREDLLRAANALFEIIKSGKVKIEINQEFAFSEIPQAHCALENRQTTGATIINVD